MDRLESLDRRTSGRVASVAGGVAIGLLVGSLVFLFLDRNGPHPEQTTVWGLSGVADRVDSIAVCVLGILIAVKRPENPIGWVFLAAGSTLALGNFGEAYAQHALVASPGSLPGGLAFDWINNVMWPIPLAMLVLLLLLFPTGVPPSRRWRPVAVGVLVWGAILVLATSVVAAGMWNQPFSQRIPPAGFGHLVGAVLFPIAFLCLPLMLVLALVAVVMRYRRSRGEERLQLKWFTFTAAFVVVTFIGGFFGNEAWQLASSVTLIALWVAIAIAMLKYRLYDIDLVIRKTVVGGVLLVFVTLVYLVVVAGVGALGSTSDVLRSGPLTAIATAVVAIAFQPVLRRARHLANRVVYGERATPYEVLSEFSERMGEAYATDDLPKRMARILGEGTGAATASVWLHVGDELRAAATWPADAPVLAPVGAPAPEEGLVEIPGASGAFPVRHQGELLGALSVQMPRDESFGSEQEKLCTDLAAQAGLVLRNVRLIEDLRASRQRLVAAQDDERRKIERNLHDGAQQQLVALAVKGRIVSGLLDRDPAKARSLLEEIQTETTDALETLRDLAHGIYPPVLADQGLPAALQAQARKAPLPVEIDADGVGRHPPEVEAAVYFSLLEALQNVSKYAAATHVSVRLRIEGAALVFDVRDDGAGFDPVRTKMGSGLQGIADRLAALGGGVDVASAPGEGTSVMGRVPLAG